MPFNLMFSTSSSVSIPQGTINTLSGTVCMFVHFKFPFRKVQLILPGLFENAFVTLFPFRKVQLILYLASSTDNSKSVSIPQGTINTFLSSIHLRMIHKFPFRKVQLILDLIGKIDTYKSVSIPQGTINTYPVRRTRLYFSSFHSARYN